MNKKETIDAIFIELERAEKFHPYWPSDLIHQAAIVVEEAGELVQAAINVTYANGEKEDVKKEAIQTAAMAIRLLLNLAD